MLSTVTYALSKKYTDKTVEKATDGVVDKAVNKAISKIVPTFFEFSDDVNQRVDQCNERVDQCNERTNENKDLVETIRQGYGRYLLDFKGLRQYIDEEQDPVYAWNGERYVVSSDSVVRRVIDRDYKCRVFDIPEFIETEWVFDAYCNYDISQPIAILWLDTSDISDEIPPDQIPPSQYIPIRATKAGPVDKTIILDRLRWNFPKYGSFLDGCRIILNSYKSEPILYKHKFDKINVYTKDETDAAIENVSQSMDALSQSVNELSEQLDTVKADMSIIDKKADASSSISGKRFGFSNNKLASIDDEDYECKVYFGYDIADKEWVFDAYCNDINVPVAIICRDGAGDSQDLCIPIYATKVGPINKTISITKESTGYPNDWGTIVLNSYQSEPTLYQHRLDVYTREGTDAAIANAINSAITNVINTAY